jgi:hypothetical protein
MSETFSPREDQYLRVRYDSEIPGWVLEQQLRLNPNGITDPGQLAALIGLGEDQWEERGVFRDILTATQQVVALMYEENVTIVSFDRGPLAPLSPPVDRARQQLSRLRL